MENALLEAVRIFNPVQTIFLFILGIIAYFKLKNRIETSINGLGARFDRQFGEYKNANAEKFNQIEQRIVRLEVEQGFAVQTKAILERLDSVARALSCKQA